MTRMLLNHKVGVADQEKLDLFPFYKTVLSTVKFYINYCIYIIRKSIKFSLDIASLGQCAYQLNNTFVLTSST